MWRSLLPALFLVACVGDDPAPVATPTTTTPTTTDGGTTTPKADTTNFLGMWSTPAGIQASSACNEKALETTDNAPVTYTIATGSNGADLSLSNTIAPGCVLLANIDTGAVTASLLPNQTCTFSIKDPDGVNVHILYQYAATSHFSLQSSHTTGSVHIDATFKLTGGEHTGEGCTFTEDDALTKQ